MRTAKPWPDEGRLKPNEEDEIKRVIALQLMRPVIEDNRQKLLEHKGVLQRAYRMTLEVFAQRTSEELQRERRRLSNERIHVRQVVPRRGMIVMSYTCRSFPGELELTHQEAEYLREQLIDDYIEFFFGRKS
ncbi:MULTISPECIES: hypothetical protein [unclassified Paenibacillus]|uniref:hypothetical protein n=1 Tax=unclassified Paenibacillus TaxID=185978 RepID=UPI000956DF01|nr:MULTISPECIES: hypothetical protein [unclassified Paenibacillus]ASS64767.2 hypothetical protein CIC07_00575 [Paenibacillus sp. RUD330]SIR06847.1 hypothetical protein SAMN05880555_2945 [Paenibacillus sp. RU4X]SIR28782.1 hypothetical protein SAMN05880570_3055 [Paenibacillus sp. RU4T]